ncbi:MAG TPA: ABC transporter ATP-binding protein, partial [Candidatus Hydrogenedentes bacterium]|nr:ABC transporter ATP-binding protein [Candidatus Hydrogenedentota bacterium]
KRRANLAAGLLSEPPILVLDEPTVGVDAQSRNVLIENLKAINQSGTTIVYTTHYMEEAEALCTRIAILDAGGVIAQGEPAELIARQKDCSSLVQLFLALTGKELRE